jgi:hypothetical protein
MPIWAVVRDRPRVLFEDHSNVTTSTPVVGTYQKLNKVSFILTKTHTTGTYTATFDWSLDGSTSIFQTTSSPANNTPTTISAEAPWVRVTISASVSNFTAHETVVMI